MYTPTANTYFSGGGLMDLGLSLAGIQIIQALEIDPVCVDTLKRNFTHAVVQADISKVTVTDQPESDVIVGTYPCTKYSAIADIHGARTGDELYLHFFRHIALRQPEAYVLENVPGMLKFPVVMEAMSKLPGYFIHIFCPIDALTWLPQRRERLILVGTRRKINISEPRATKRVSIADIIESRPDVEITEAVKNRLAGRYRDMPIITDPEKGDIAPTCVAHYAKDRSTRLVVDKSHPNKVRPYTVREYARLMGVPDSFQFSGTENQQFKQIGNGVVVQLGEWIGKELIKYFN